MTLLNARAMTVYLWHNLLLVGTVLLVDVLWESEVLATAVPGLLASPWLSFVLVWPLLAVVVLAVGWAEDLAAGRRPRLWPVRPAAAPATAPAPVPAPAAAASAGQGAAGTGFPGRSWLYPRSVREPASPAALSPRSPRGGPG